MPQRKKNKSAARILWESLKAWVKRDYWRYRYPGTVMQDSGRYWMLKSGILQREGGATVIYQDRRTIWTIVNGELKKHEIKGNLILIIIRIISIILAVSGLIALKSYDSTPLIIVIFMIIINTIAPLYEAKKSKEKKALFSQETEPAVQPYFIHENE